MSNSLADTDPTLSQSTALSSFEGHIRTLDAIQRRLLWLAVRIVDYANRERPDPGDGVKVGGHQASSASMVSIMTALWFAHLDAHDRVSVKPHASPVLHAIHYLLRNLEREDLLTLRSFGGLQAYPSVTKDRFRVDFPTGSVGHGAVAPLFAAATRRYVESHFGARARPRFVALIGDAELDEGNIWEAVAESATAGLGNVLWVVDLNRQSLDRIVPDIQVRRWRGMFEANGWHVTEAKYGSRLAALFEKPGGDVLARRLDEMRNDEYQQLLFGPPEDVRHRLTGEDRQVADLLRPVPDNDLLSLVRDLGGHDLNALLRAFRECDQVDDRPSVVFAYTVKGWRLPLEGNPLNHAALLSESQVDDLRNRLGPEEPDEWSHFPHDSPEDRLCRATAKRLLLETRTELRTEEGDDPDTSVPPEIGLATSRRLSTQEAFGRLLGQLARTHPLGRRIVTTSPDVATSTNLGGWINRVGVFHPLGRTELSIDGPLKWKEHPAGQHIELGISEMNLMAMLGQLGRAGELHGEPLVPIGTVYDPFVSRGLDALIYALYSGARFILVGTPSGITLAPEGGAHQSTVTPSVGLELPGLTYAEPAYAAELDWLLCGGLRRIVAGDNDPSMYLRLTTRPVDQSPFSDLRERLGDDVLRKDVLAGGYLLLESRAMARNGAPPLLLVTAGALAPEALAAAWMLREEGVAANLIVASSPDQLYRDWRRTFCAGIRRARTPSVDHHLAHLIRPEEREAPIVTVHDSASHTLAWLGSVFGAPAVALGVDRFGQSGSVSDLYREHDLSAESIVNAALVAIQSRPEHSQMPATTQAATDL